MITISMSRSISFLRRKQTALIPCVNELGTEFLLNIV